MNQSTATSTLQPDNLVTVLAVTPSAIAQNRLNQIFGHTNWQLETAGSCYEALRRLRDLHTAVVVCEHQLPDGGWQDLLSGVLQLPSPPNVIVTAPDADDVLWSDVLNRGGYDVLARPFDSSEVVRIISLAWMNWKQTYKRSPARECASVARSASAAMPTSA
ncbi:MAG: hypothetical protein ABI972_14345 [Acidobacteriota bacterium]